MDRLGALGEEFDLGMKLSVTGAAVEPMMCGWLEIFQPVDGVGVQRGLHDLEFGRGCDRLDVDLGRDCFLPPTGSLEFKQHASLEDIGCKTIWMVGLFLGLLMVNYRARFLLCICAQPLLLQPIYEDEEPLFQQDPLMIVQKELICVT